MVGLKFSEIPVIVEVQIVKSVESVQHDNRDPIVK